MKKLSALFGAMILTASMLLASQPVFNGQYEITGVDGNTNTGWQLTGTFEDGSLSGWAASDCPTNARIFSYSGYGDVDKYRVTNVVVAAGLTLTVDVIYDETGTPRNGAPSPGYQIIAGPGADGVVYEIPTIGRLSELLQNYARNLSLKYAIAYAATSGVSSISSTGAVTGAITFSGDGVTQTNNDFNFSGGGGGAGNITNLISSDGSVVITAPGGPQPDLSVTGYVAGVVAGYATTGDVVRLTGDHTIAGALYSSKTSSQTGPISIQFGTAGWVRSLFGGGAVWYNSTNVASSTNYYEFRPVTQSVMVGRDYGVVTQDQHVGRVITTTRYTKVSGSIVVSDWMARSESPADFLGVHPDIHFSYDGTNVAGATYRALEQAIAANTNRYIWIVPNISFVATNGDVGAFIMRDYYIDSAVSDPTLTVCIGGGCNGGMSIPIATADTDIGIRGQTGLLYNVGGMITQAAYNATTRQGTINTIPTSTLWHVGENVTNATDEQARADIVLASNAIPTTAAQVGAVATNDFADHEANLVVDVLHLTEAEKAIATNDLSGRVSGLEGATGSYYLVSNPDGFIAGLLKSGDTATTQGKIYQQLSDGTWQMTYNTNVAFCNKGIGIAYGTNSTIDGMVVLGQITVTNNNLQRGSNVYVNATAGEFTQVIPTANGSVVRAIGWAKNTNEIYVTPSPVWVEIGELISENVNFNTYNATNIGLAQVTELQVTGLSGNGVIPPGGMIEWGSSNAPAGWLLCNGASVATNTYPALFAAIGTQYGSTNAAWFKVPDRRGRVAIGMGAGTGLTARNLGETNGTETHAHTVGSYAVASHTLTVAQMPSHTHPETTVGGSGALSGGTTYANVAANTGSTGGDGGHTHGFTGMSANGTNMPPFIVVNFIIKY